MYKLNKPFSTKSSVQIPPGVNITNVLQAVFTRADPESAKDS